MCMVQPKIQNLPIITFHPHKSEYPVSISSISPHSSLELDTDHGYMIDETIKHVTHTLNQTLMTSKPCNTYTNKDPLTPNNDISDIQPTQDVNLHTTPKTANTKLKTDINKIHPPRDSITPSIAMFNQTKQIITDIDKLSHSPTLCNKVSQSLNINGLCKYDHSCQAYLFEHSNKPVNCSQILVFLKQSTCYTINTDTHQWYRINMKKIIDNHTIAICNGSTINMVLSMPAEPLRSMPLKLL